MEVNLDDTRKCPLQNHCAICGASTSLELAATFDTPLGVMCATLCDRCVEKKRPMPRLPLMNVVRRVAAHCEHLGITVEEMAQAMKSEKAM